MGQLENEIDGVLLPLLNGAIEHVTEEGQIPGLEGG
jgi:hypothetical protein